MTDPGRGGAGAAHSERAYDLCAPGPPRPCRQHAATRPRDAARPALHEPCGALEERDFALPETPCPTAPEPEGGEIEGAYADPFELDDAATDRVEHAPHLALAPLAHHDLELAATDDARPQRPRRTVVEPYTPLQPLGERAIDARRHDAHAVHALDAVTGVHQALGEPPIVGEDEEAGRVGVETADRVQAPRRRHKIDDGGPPLRVAGGRNDPARLVQHPHLERFGAHRPTVDRHLDTLVDVARGIGDRFASDLDTPGAHELLARAPGGDTTAGEVLRESHGRESATLAAVDLVLLERTIDELGEPAYRVRQVWRWLARGAASWEEMTDLPLALRRELAARVPISTLAVVASARARDGTEKVLFRTADGKPLEAVLMRYHDGRRSLCLSSQSGCPLTCTFCQTGRMRFGRNLTASEIIDQALYFRRDERPTHAVFMGMGEPLMNLDAVLAACERLPDIGIAHRRTAISTVGWLPGIERLAREGPPVRLALSLHAPNDALRSELMPINERYPIAAVLDACRKWWRHRRRQVFVEYLMLAGVNDRYEQALELAALLRPREAFCVNLIPYNPTDAPYRGSSRRAIDAFRRALEERGVRATVRLTRGREIAAACGQLAARQPLAAVAGG